MRKKKREEVEKMREKGEEKNQYLVQILSWETDDQSS